MSLLNGSMPKRCPDDFEDFVGDFIDGITDEEWAHIAQLPPIPRWTLFVAAVVAIRAELAWPLADRDHPLNPAARAAVNV